jgi:hypothetical protein
MKLQTLLEFTAADLLRKIRALEALIKDPAATAGEKENAKARKQTLQNRLNKEFPNEKTYDDYLVGLARAFEKEQELKDLKQTDPDEYRKIMLAKLDRMKTKLSGMRKRHTPGNVDTATEIRDYEYEVDNFIRREFPDMWKEIVSKRKEANRRSYERTQKKSTEKRKAGRAAVKAEKKGTFKTQGKQFESALKELYNSLMGVKFRPAYNFSAEVGKGYDKWGSGGKFLETLKFIPNGKIREKWNNLDEKTQQDLIQAVDGVNTQGSAFGGYTPAQKKALLTAMSEYKSK